MCKLTLFVIMKDGDIDFMGGGKMEMVYQADDEYFDFLNQQVKELHMERSQGFITSVFQALTGSRCKTRRRQVTRIPPTPVTLSDSQPRKALAEDATQDEFVAKLLATLEEDHSEKPNQNNDLGESYLAEIWQSGKHIPLICTNVEEHKLLINHFNENLNAKIFNTFTDLFSNVNMDSI